MAKQLAHLKEILDPTSSLFFLVGAGVSKDPPAGLPTGEDFVNSFYDFLVSGEDDAAFSQYVPVLKRATALRFEKIMSLIERNFRSKTRPLLNRYSKASVYNLNHLCLARLAEAGHTVATTNFDSLIERAASAKAMESLVWDEDYGVIHEKPVIHKLHGAFQRYLANAGQWQDVSQSVQLTLEQVGLQGYGFVMSPNKARFLQGQLAEKDLVVIGYSGSDDFDIIPILTQRHSPRRLIWCEYSADEEGVLPFEAATQDGASRRAVGRLANMVAKGIRTADACLLVQGRAHRCLEAIMDAVKVTRAREERRQPDRSLDGACFEEGLREVMPDQVSIVRMKAMLHLEAGAFEKSLGYYKRILSAVRAGRDQLLKSKVLYEIAMCYMGQKPPSVDSALEYAEESYRIDIENNHGFVFLSADVLARLYRDKGELVKAVSLFQVVCEATSKFAEPYCKYQRATLLNNYAVLLFQMGRYDDAIVQKRRACELFVEVGDLGGQVATAIGLAGALMESNRAPQALAELQRVEQIAVDLGDNGALCSFYNELGIVLRYLGDLPGAIASHEKAGDYATVQDNAIELARQYYNMALCELKRGDEARATTLNDRSLEIRRRVKVPYQQAMGMAECHQLKANLCVRKGDYVKAKEFLAASNRYGNRIGYQQLLADNMLIEMRIRCMGG